VLPSGVADDAVGVRVIAGIRGTTAEQCRAGIGQNCIEASRVIRFVSHRALRLPIDLELSCLNVKCPAQYTCRSGDCVPEDVPPGCTDLTDPKCRDGSVVPPIDGSIIEASVIDAAFDSGPLDAGVPLVNVALIAAGGNVTCALGADARVWCWGETGAPQLMGQTGIVPVPMPMGAGVITMLTVGSLHACASDGTSTYCWGDNGSGQIGDGNAGGVIGSPTKVVPQNWKPTAIAAGGQHTCAVDGQSVYCWGQMPGGFASKAPQAVTPAKGFVGIAAGWSHACARDANGSVFCFGSNSYGQLGPQYAASVSAAPSPTLSSAVGAAVVVGGGDHSGFIGNSMAALAFGRNVDYEVTPTNTMAPAAMSMASPVPPSGTANTFAMGGKHGCSILFGQVRCWGNNATSQLGGGMGPVASVTIPNNANMLAQVVAGDGHSCARTATGAVYCWGSVYGSKVKALTTPTRILGP
jgi:alpha-tubulin suppressor-like RCC1 family protein